MLLQTLIFITGAAILSLELLASRVMTPYFGVSLYIWSGILSITLLALALGYWGGGQLALGRDGKALPDGQLRRRFLAMPVIAALALLVACVAYPYLFPLLARNDLVTGAFVACIVLLFLPLDRKSTRLNSSHT